MLFDLAWVFVFEEPPPPPVLWTAAARLESGVCYIDAMHSNAQFHAGEVAVEGCVCFKG